MFAPQRSLDPSSFARRLERQNKRRLPAQPPRPIPTTAASATPTTATPTTASTAGSANLLPLTPPARSDALSTAPRAPAATSPALLSPRRPRRDDNMPPVLRPRPWAGPAGRVQKSAARQRPSTFGTRFNKRSPRSGSSGKAYPAWGTSGADWSRINAERSRKVPTVEAATERPGHIDTTQPAEDLRPHDKRMTNSRPHTPGSKQGNGAEGMGSRSINTTGRTETPGHNALAAASLVPANTSAKRSRDDLDHTPQKRSKEDSSSRCYSCSVALPNQPVHACRLCPHIWFCLQCCVKAAKIHPDHPFKLIQPKSAAAKESVVPRVVEAAETRSRHYQPRPDAQEGNGDEVRRGSHEDPNNVDPSSVNSPVAEAAAFTHLPSCATCGKNLPSLRYKCQTCSDTNFCSRCRGLHAHPLKTFTCPMDGSSECSSECSSEDESTDNIIEDDPGLVGDDDDAGTETGTETSTGKLDSTANATDSIELIQRPAQLVAPLSEALYTNMTSEDVIQIKDALLAAATKLQGILSKKGTRPTLPSGVSVPTSLLKFPIEFSTLNGDPGMESDAEGGDSHELDGADSDELDGADSDEGRLGRKHCKSRGSRRVWTWTEKDRHQLRGMKEKGWPLARIAKALGRSEGAVMQQWRKQKMGL